jgi:hypothetical protein
MVYTCCVTVCHGISTVYPSKTHHEGSTAGFRGAQRELRDAAARVILEPPVQSFLEQGEADPCPEPEDEEFYFENQTQRARKRRSTSFLYGMEDQERSGFKGIDTLLGRMPAPAGKQTRSMSHAEARAGAFLPYIELKGRNDLRHQN